MNSERSRRAVATFRQRIGEAAFAEHMRRLREKRRDFGKSPIPAGLRRQAGARRIRDRGRGWSNRRENATL